MDTRTFEVAATPPNEAQRLASLRSYGVLDTAPEDAFDDLTQLASRLCKAPIALISLADETRQWFKSRVGLDATQTPRDWAFCAHAVLHTSLFEVPDARNDARFAANPLVVGTPHVRFYAGMPLVAPDGQVLGTLCVISPQPRSLATAERDVLARLARQVVQLLELRRLRLVQAQAESRLQRQADDLRRLALVAERTGNAVMLADTQCRITWVNAAFTRITGYRADEAVGRKPGDLLNFEGTDPAAHAQLRQGVTNQLPAHVQILNRSKHGRVYWTDTDLQPLHSAEGVLEGFVVVQTDVSQLVQQREEAKTLLQALPISVMVYDENASVLRINLSAERILGVSTAAMVGHVPRLADRDMRDADGRPLAETERPAVRALRSGEPVHDHLISMTAPGGGRRWLRVSAVPLRDAAGRCTGAVSCFADVTEWRHQRHLLERAFDAARVAPWNWDVQQDVVAISARWAISLGFVPSTAAPDADGMVHGSLFAFTHRDDVPAVRAALERHFSDRTVPFRAEYRLRDSQKRWRWVLGCGSVVEQAPDGTPLRMSGVVIDADDRKRSEAELLFAATTDALTGLPNRAVLRDRLGLALAAARRRGQHGALLFLDLDHFKRVNDTHGHAVGDTLLRQVAGRLSAVLRGEDTLARMGGDELMVLLPAIGPDPGPAARHAELVAHKLIAALEAPFHLAVGECHIGASIGSTLFPKAPAETVDDLVREADTAMYAAKESGRGLMRPFESALQQSVTRRFELERDLKHALARNELSLHLQPKWRADGSLHGAEALLRWAHPQRGAVSPVDFIPVAEDGGLILPIGHWVLQQACSIVAAQRQAGRPLSLAVNVSPRQFREPAFIAQLDELLRSTGAQPGDLTLEFTEGVLIDNIDAGARRMGELAARGLRLSIDDFGTGYSSLMYLKKLPIHELKIDRAFVRDITTDKNDAAIALAILAIAKRFNIAAVAEGVETQAQADFLIAQGCPVLQGYLYGRPVPVAEFLARYGVSPCLPA